jgi:hypothetical protein
MTEYKYLLFMFLMEIDILYSLRAKDTECGVAQGK